MSIYDDFDDDSLLTDITAFGADASVSIVEGIIAKGGVKLPNVPGVPNIPGVPSMPNMSNIPGVSAASGVLGDITRGVSDPSEFKDFLSIGTPAIAAWDDLQKGLHLEGAIDTEVQRAKLLIGKAGMQFLSSIDNDTDAAVASAHDIVKIGATLVGNLSNIEGLVASVEKGDVAQMAQLTIGLLVSAAVAAGAVSMGIGAAVVGCVAAISSVFKTKDLYSYVFDSCPGYAYMDKPTYLCGCMPQFHLANTAPMAQTAGGPVPVSSKAWSPIPKRGWEWGKRDANGALIWTHTGKDDKMFFADVKWYSDNYKGVRFPDSVLAQNPIMMDLWFPGYSAIMDRPIIPGASAEVRKFLETFKAAWLMNKESQFNGHKGVPDSDVLGRAVRTWNHCHDLSGPSYVLGSKPSVLPVGAAVMTAQVLEAKDKASESQLIIYTRQRQPAPVVVVQVPRNIVSLAVGDAGGLPAAMARQAAAAKAAAAVAPPYHPLHMTVLDATKGAVPTLTKVSSIAKHLPAGMVKFVGHVPSKATLMHYTPMVVGLALTPFLGFVAPVIGGALSALWINLGKK
jgi:hypothetical protein